TRWAGGMGASEPKPREPRHFEDLTADLPSEAVTAIAVDPDDDTVLYAGTDGFAWKSDDAGETWRPILSFPRGVALTEDTAPVDGDEAGQDTGVDVSDVPLVALPAAGDSAAAPSEGEASEDGSSDDLPDGDASDASDAISFSRQGVGVRSIAFVPGSASVFYVATPRGLYRTATKGSAFERITIPGGVAENDVRDVVVDPSRPSRLYLATAAGLLESKDGGASIFPVDGLAGHQAMLCAAMAPDGVVILVGGERGLFRSFDGGASFLEVLLRGLPPFFAVAAVAVSQKSGSYYAGTADGLFVGERGAALLERYDGVPSVLVQALLTDKDLLRGIAVGTRGRGVMFSGNAGNTIDENAEQVPAQEVFALARGKKKGDVVVATDRGVFRSVPGTGILISSSALKKLRAQWATEPTLEVAARQALDYQRLDNRGREMAGRASWAAILPSVSARYSITYGETTVGDQFILRAGDDLPPGVDPANDNTDIFGNVGAFLLQPEVGTRQEFFVSLQWDLDKLILNDSEVQIGRRIPQWWAAEKRVLDRVREAFSARRRLMAEVMLDTPRGAAAVKLDAMKRLRLDELTAELDAATGGAFSAQSQKQQQQEVR
ncbi:MAG TPA: hypothetical protein VGO62_07915, partial [Myxococcota bacterium]